MIKHISFLLVLMSLLLIPGTALANAPVLPTSTWYAVIYQPETDTLNWMNPQGNQGQMARPHLPDESQYLDMRISPNGRTMVLVSLLNNGQQGIGIYDFVTGVFVAIHQAQPGETVNLGGENVFSASSQYFAVGLYSGDFGSPAWRVILFESQNGSAAAFINNTYPNAPQVQLSAPAVQYIDSTSVHFQLIPQATDAWTTFPAFAWHVFGFDPVVPTITESPYTPANIQVQLLTGIAVTPYTDDGYAVAFREGPGPGFNAIGTSIPGGDGTVTPVHADGTRYHLAARWAKGGEWILFLSDDIDSNRYWNIVLANGTPGNNSHIPFDPQFVQVYGTSDGYLLVNTARQLFYTNGFSPVTAMNIALLSPTAKVVYVTPIGITFMLPQLPGEPVQDFVAPPAVVTPVPPVVVSPAAPDVPCATAPTSRVAVGAMARVVMTTSLNVRQQPNGAKIATYEPGTTLNIIAGYACVDNLYWWQIERYGTVGWVAEALPAEYLIEPYAGPMTPDEAEPPVFVPPAAELPEANPEAPAAPSECENALPPRLAIGTSAIVVADSIRPYNGPAGNIYAQRFYLAGTGLMVNAGPECSGGQHWWLVTGTVKIGRIGNRTESFQGWISEGNNGAYFVAP